MTRFSGSAATLAAATCLAAVAACGDNQSASPDDLTRRAYVVAQESDELTVIDIDTHEIVGQVHTLGLGNHMAELSPDFAKVYVSSPGTAEVIVVDARTLTRTGSIGVGRHPTHMSLSRDGRYLAVVNEEDNAVSFIDPVTDTEVKRIDGFATPHFVRYAADQRTAYVANIGAHHLSVVDLDPWNVGKVAAAMVFPADDSTDALFAQGPPTRDNLNLLRGYTNMKKLRWVRPDNIRVSRLLA